MAEKTEHPEVPTYFSNMVTMQLNSDELVMEFRSLRQEHRRNINGEGSIIDIPAATPEEIFSLDPIARVVVTFNSVLAMKQFLDDAVPAALANRKK
jgi:hypothetical protein